MRLWIAFILFAALIGVVLGVIEKNGREDEASADAEPPMPVETAAVVQPGKLSLAAVDTRMTPVADLDLVVRDANGEDIVELRTDAAGRAFAEDMPLEPLTVYAPSLRRDVGTADLTSGSKTVTLDIPAVRKLLVCLRVDGCKAVPADLDIHVSGGTVLSKAPGEEHGSVAITTRPFRSAGNVEVLLKGCGIKPQRVVLGPDAVSQHWPLQIETSHALSLEVTPPKDGVYQLEVHRYDALAGVWTYATAVETAEGGAATPGLHRFERLRRGRYRVLDLRSGLLTRPIELGASASANAKLEFDLSDVVAIRGRVTTGKADVDGARILVSGAVDSLHPYARHGFPVLRTGAFQARVRAGAPFTLTPWHPLLTPAEVGGSYTGSSAPEDLELSMEMGPQVVFSLDPAQVTSSRYRERRFRVYAYRPGGKKPVAVCEPQPMPGAEEAGTYRFGGIRLGSYTFVFHVPGHPPLTQADVFVEGSTVSLGTLRLKPGAHIQVNFAVEPGRRVPAIKMRAVSMKDPRYVRETKGDGRRTSFLKGLGNGTFAVSFVDEKGRPVASSQKVEIKNDQPVTIMVDLRE